MLHRTVLEELTSTYDEVGMRCERDAFDALFESPDKLHVVKSVCIHILCVISLSEIGRFLSFNSSGQA